MTLATRPATPADAADLAVLLNEIIAAGGTTAYEDPVDAAWIDRHYISAPGLVSCTVAELDGRLSAFQGLFWPDDPADPFPEGWAVIATFVRRGLTGAGIGGALFRATRTAARAAGVRSIDATIRADNTGGLAYYAKMGFADYDRLVGVPLRDGTPVDRIRKRLDP
jgi:GNAT superfamily N-acetyltransferase